MEGCRHSRLHTCQTRTREGREQTAAGQTRGCWRRAVSVHLCGCWNTQSRVLWTTRREEGSAVRGGALHTPLLPTELSLRYQLNAPAVSKRKWVIQDQDIPKASSMLPHGQTHTQRAGGGEAALCGVPDALRHPAHLCSSLVLRYHGLLAEGTTPGGCWASRPCRDQGFLHNLPKAAAQLQELPHPQPHLSGEGQTHASLHNSLTSPGQRLQIQGLNSRRVSP